MLRYVYLLFILLLGGCVSSPVFKKHETEDMVSSFEAWGGDYQSLKLKNFGALYELDENAVGDCTYVERVSLQQVIAKDFIYVSSYKIDCGLAKMFLSAQRYSKNSYLPEQLNENFIKKLPAAGATIVSKEMWEKNKHKRVEELGIGKVERLDKHTMLADFPYTYKVRYRELARADFNGNGTEEVAILKHWWVEEAHGKWLDLLIVEIPEENGLPKVTWQFTDSPLWE